MGLDGQLRVLTATGVKPAKTILSSQSSVVWRESFLVNIDRGYDEFFHLLAQFSFFQDETNLVLQFAVLKLANITSN